MVNAIGKIMITLAALLPAPGMKEEIKPPLAETERIEVRVLPHRIDSPDFDAKFSYPERKQDSKRKEGVRHTDGNYVVEGETSMSADERYKALKAALDERFAYMFELKDALEHAQTQISGKWEEYHALHEKYTKELKKLVGMWVMEQNYTVEK